MNARPVFAALLLRLYPAGWRREYGEELRHILESQPMTAAIAVDVIASGLRLRVRSASPATILGLISMLLVASQLLLAPDGLGRYLPAAVRPSGMTFPTLRMTLLASEIYVYIGIACGYWTESRSPGSAARAGVAAMRMVLMGGSPVMLAGLLLAAGIADPALARVAGRGFEPSPLAMMLAPLAAAPPFWIWGVGGAWLKQWVNRRRESRLQKLT
jgi:hypothetical protein